MAIALNNTIRNYRSRFVNGPAGQFFRWWAKELRCAMPERLRARMEYARRRLLIQLGDGEINFSIDNAIEVQALDSFVEQQDIQIQQQQVRELLQQHELTEVHRDLLLTDDDVLRIDVVMPLAAESKLRQALAYEMDRHTPFQAEEVFFTWRDLRRDREARQLSFELIVTPREPLEARIALLRRLGLAPTGVDVTDKDGPARINLLPEALCHRVINKRVRANWLIGTAVIILLVVVMAQSLWLREHQINELEDAIESVRAEAMAVQQIRQQIEDASEAAGFLQDRKAHNGSKLEILAELTSILPDDTYLDRLTMHAETVQMQGKSNSAQSLIELINASPSFENASFRGPTRLDNRSRKEIFDLNAKITQQSGY